jgi:hypothetical protein
VKKTLTLAACLTAAFLLGGAVSGQKEKKMNRVFEMRTYFAAEGKMKDLHARFRDHTCRLFKKHGMELVGFWSPTDAKEAEKKMVYVLAYPSKEAADKSWKAFREDKEWIDAKAKSEKDGSLVAKIESVFLDPTDYSPMK